MSAQSLRNDRSTSIQASFDALMDEARAAKKEANDAQIAYLQAKHALKVYEDRRDIAEGAKLLEKTPDGKRVIDGSNPELRKAQLYEACKLDHITVEHAREELLSAEVRWSVACRNYEFYRLIVDAGHLFKG